MYQANTALRFTFAHDGVQVDGYAVEVEEPTGADPPVTWNEIVTGGPEAYDSATGVVTLDRDAGLPAKHDDYVVRAVVHGGQVNPQRLEGEETAFQVTDGPVTEPGEIVVDLRVTGTVRMPGR